MDYPKSFENGKECSHPSKNTNFFVNSILHILILLIIVSSFFFVFVSKLSEQAFKEQLADLINNNLTPALQKADNDQALKSLINVLNIQNITNYYQTQSDAAMKIQDGWLKKVTLLSIMMLIITIFLTIVILKQSCGMCVPIGHIFKENLIMFFFIGLVEVGFFMLIAKKFVPAKPSTMLNSIVESLKANFN